MYFLQCEGKHNVLIYDLGGGTCDVSVMTLGDGVCEVKSTSGDTHLGGEDFDSRLVNHFLHKFRREDRTTEHASLVRMRRTSERIKRNLSSQERSG